MSLVNTDGENLQGFFQGFFLALEDTFLEKPQGGGGQFLPPPPPPPAFTVLMVSAKND